MLCLYYMHYKQIMQDNSLLSFAEIHFSSEMFKLRLFVFKIHVNIIDVLVLVDGGSFIGS